MEKFIVISGSGGTSSGKPNTLEACEKWAGEQLGLPGKNNMKIYLCEVKEVFELAVAPIKRTKFIPAEPDGNQ